VVGIFGNKNIFTLQLKVILIILINVRPVDRQTFHNSNTQHTDTDRQTVSKCTIFIITTVVVTCTVVQYSPLKEKCGNCVLQTVLVVATLYKTGAVQIFQKGIKTLCVTSCLSFSGGITVFWSYVDCKSMSFFFFLFLWIVINIDIRAVYYCIVFYCRW
jgi:hypothetical protein